MQKPSRFRWFSIMGSLVWALAVLWPVALVIWFIWKYYVDVPFLDQWEFVPLLRKSYEGHFALSDLWAQHNEHRLLFPRLIWLALAHLTHWNGYYELATNVLLAGLTFVVISLQLRATARAVGARRAIWMIPLLSFVVFSLNQHENWLWGWDIQIFLNVLAVVAGLVLLANPLCDWRRFAAALALGVVALYSFANGIAYWLLGLPILLLVRPESRRILRLRIVLWTLAGAAVIYSYVYDFQPVSYHPSWSFIFQHPIGWLKYVGAYLGAPCITSRKELAGVSMWVGLAGFLVLCSTTWLLLRVQRLELRRLTPYLAISLYGIGSAMITGIGRAGFGAHQAMSSRYVTIGDLLWIPNIILLYLLASRAKVPGERGAGASSAGVMRFGGWIGLVAIMLMMTYSMIDGYTVGEKRHAYFEPVLVELSQGQDYTDEAFRDFCLSQLNPIRVPLVEQGLVFQEQYHLSLFREK